jgi:hypothetical protein
VKAQLRSRLLLHLNAQMRQQVSEKARVGQARHARQDQLAVGEQAGRHEFQRGVLRARNLNIAVERLAAANPNPIHESSLFLLADASQQPPAPANPSGFGAFRHATAQSSSRP